MTIQRSYMGSKLPKSIDETRAEFPLNTGIYKGVVKALDTSSRNGRIFVYIPSFGGDDPDIDLYWTPVTYASPFGGATLGQNPGAPPNQKNSFTSTKQSYGWFTSPPDIGSIVLCCFPDGVRLEGFWFASVDPNLSRYMTPAIGAVPVDKIDAESVPPNIQPLLRPGANYPVSEFNENVKRVFNSDWPNNLKPLHIPQTLNLLRQGLDEDKDRGAISSSMQRDPVSAVYGFSTPGRPYQSQDPANDKNLAEKLRTGDFDPKQWEVTTRVGGHSLVMDDGNIFNDNNLVRLKTSAGHQILMNDSKGFMYISTASGNNWIELTARGDLLIYNRGDMVVRSQGDISLHSNKNINFYANNRINMSSGNTIAIESNRITAKATTQLNLFGKDAQISGSSSLNVISRGRMAIKATAKMSIDARLIDMNGSGSSSAPLPTPSSLKKFTSRDTSFTGGKWEANKTLESIIANVPSHEPYARRTISTTSISSTATPSVTTTSPSLVGKIDPFITEGQANAAAFISQGKLQPPNPIGPLSSDEVAALFAQIGFAESVGSGGYAAVSKSGLALGKYQFTPIGLKDVSYLKDGTPLTAEALNNPNNWRTDAIGSKQAFLTNQEAQETAMATLTAKNYQRLVNAKVITSSTPKEEIAGYLAAAHLLGNGDTINWAFGRPASSSRGFYDGNGTYIGKWFNLGKYSQEQVGQVTKARGIT